MTTKPPQKPAQNSRPNTGDAIVAATPIERGEGGRFAKGNTAAFKPGQSGNAGGRPQLPDFVKKRGPDLLRVQLRAAVEGVVARKSTDGEVLLPIDAKTQIEIGDRLIDRVYGKAIQAHDVKARGEGLLARLFEKWEESPPPMPDTDDIGEGGEPVETHGDDEHEGEGADE